MAEGSVNPPILEPPKEQVIKLPKDVMPKFFIWLENNNYAYKTISFYGKYVSRLLKSDKRKTLISPGKIKAFLEKKTNIPYQSSVRKFIEFLQDRYDITIPPFRYTRIRKVTKEVVPLSREEIKLIMDNMPNQDGEFKFKLITEVIANTGMRVSEVVGLRIRDIDFISWTHDRSKDGRIKLTDTKYNTERFAYVSTGMMKKLAVQCEDPEQKGLTRNKDEFVFDFNYKGTMRRYKRRQRKSKKDPSIFSYDEDLWDWKYVEKAVSYFRKIISRVSFKVLGKKARTHSFRHSLFSYLDSKGVRPTIIQRIAGHKNLSTTSNYLHPSEDEIKSVIPEEL